MTRAERHEAGTRLCRQLAAWVGRKVTPGLGRWDDAWDYVSEPSDRFMDALNQWEATGAPEDWTALDEAYVSLARAWLEADRRFLQVGHQGGKVPA